MKWFKIEKDYKIGKVSYKVMTDFMFGDYESEQDGVEMYMECCNHKADSIRIGRRKVIAY